MTDVAALRTEVRGSVLCAALMGEIDGSNADGLETRIAGVAEGLAGLVLDLAAVTFIGSAGIRLLNHLVAAREPGAAVRVVVGGSAPVAFALRVSGFRGDLLADSVPAALESLAGG